MINRLTTFVVLYRKTVLVAICVLTLVAARYSAQLQFDFTPQALFAGQHDLVEFSEKTKQTFGHSDNMLLVVQTATGKDDLLTPTALDWHVQLCRRLAQFPEIERIDALATLRVPRARFFWGSSLKLIPVIRTAAIDSEEAALVRLKVNDQPLLEGSLISADRRAMAIVLQLDPSRKDFDYLGKLSEKIKQVLFEIPAPIGYESFFGGLPALRVEIVNNLKKDQLQIIPFCILAFALIEAVIFRCWAGVVIPAAAVGVGLAWTLAALVWLGEPLTIISNILPVLLMIVGVSSCVHFLSCFAEQAECYPLDHRRAVIETVRHMALACFLTSLTTALGFLSLMFARSKLLGALGWQAAMGIGLFYLATMLVCAVLAPSFRAPRTRDRQPNLQQTSVLAHGAWMVGRWATRFPRTTILIGLLLIGGSIAVGRNTSINSDLTETFNEDHPLVAQMHLIENQLGGFMPMEIILTADSPRRFQQGDTWHRMIEFDQFARTQPEVLLTRSVVNLYQQVDRLLPGGPQLDKLQSDRLTKRLLEIHRILAQQRTRQKANNAYHRFLTSDGRQARLLLRLRDDGTKQDKVLAGLLEQQLARLFPACSGIEYLITGEAYVSAVALDRLVYDLIYSLAGVTIFIFLVIGGLMRSLRLGLISILPNIAPLVLTLGYIGLRGYSLSMSNVIVFAISLGIAVDDTIHFLARFREEIQNESDVVEAIRRTCLGTGRAIVMTTILIVCGLAILLLSAFVPTRRFAELASVTMVSALLGDLLLLPASLRLFWKSKTVSSRACHSEEVQRRDKPDG